jgi:polysaccharide export outer membrane protein
MKKMLSLLGVLAGLFFFSHPMLVSAGEGYALQPGDVLAVSVWKEPDLQGEVLVRPDGGISFPLVGNIDASGKSVEQLGEEISARIAKYLSDPVVTVSLKQMLGNRIYVLGKVNKPGEFVVNRYVDVLQALSMAGGVNPFADRNKIQVLRRGDSGQISIPFSYDAVEKGDLKQNILLQAGDIILVP